jgi:3-oxoacyl-[acyl-carrier protein] reductase
MSDKPLNGKTALVSGSARNIGRAIALELAEAGANIVINALQDQQAAETVAEEVRERGADAMVQLADVTDRPAVEQMVKAAREKFGALDILVANASARGQIDFLDMSYDAWRRTIDITLDGTFHLAQCTIPDMVDKGWGRIITLGGFAWHLGYKRRAANLTGKAGVVGLTRALAAEFGDRGITVNNISPGMIETVRPASAGAMPDAGATPVPRLGTPEEIASAAMFLAHPKQAFVNGQIIHVNGGLYYGT